MKTNVSQTSKGMVQTGSGPFEEYKMQWTSYDVKRKKIFFHNLGAGRVLFFQITYNLVFQTGRD